MLGHYLRKLLSDPTMYRPFIDSYFKGHFDFGTLASLAFGVTKTLMRLHT